jgi:hypothetical protein
MLVDPEDRGDTSLRIVGVLLQNYYRTELQNYCYKTALTIELFTDTTVRESEPKALSVLPNSETTFR